MDKKDMLFTVCCILIVAAIMLFGVYGVVTREKNVVNVDKELETGVISETIEEIKLPTVSGERVLKPFYFGSSIEEIDDMILDVRFSIDDIDLENKKIKFEIYNPDLYDAVEVNELKVGDKIVVSEEEILIDNIEENSNFVEINGGIGGSETGVSLVAADGGTYRSVVFNDHSTFAYVGETEFPFANNFVIEDYFGGDYGNDGRKASLENLSEFIKELPEGYGEFGEICTTLRVVNNEVVNITRRWIP